LVEGGKQVLRNDHLNPLTIILFIIAIPYSFTIVLTKFLINRNLKNALFVALVKLLGNTSVVGISKVATIDIRRIVGKIDRLKPLLQKFLAFTFLGSFVNYDNLGGLWLLRLHSLASWLRQAALS
jgi:hypothetical protein